MGMSAEGTDIPKNAFLIVNGSEIVPLTKEVVNIGRMDDNDIILHNAHVSRYHARLVAKSGQYTLMDLQSTGGTSVNGEKINRAGIKPGDVISLSGVPLIYGQTKGAAKLVSARSTATPQKEHSAYKEGNTESVDVNSIDQFLEMFDSPEGDEEEG
jgi:pSer/pThr/pTyr-binding forkhead associated (FHA) protein